MQIATRRKVVHNAERLGPAILTHNLSTLPLRLPHPRKLDHGVIFVFIAASYTPWLTMLDIGENNSLGQTMITVIWSMAVAGILHTMVFFNKYKVWKGGPFGSPLPPPPCL